MTVLNKIKEGRLYPRKKGFYFTEMFCGVIICFQF